MRQRRKSSLISLLLVLIFSMSGCGIVWLGIPYMAVLQFGDPNPALTGFQKWSYSLRVVLQKNDLKKPVTADKRLSEFVIQTNESINSVAGRLESSGLIHDASAFRSYLIYKGLDSQIKAGKFNLSASLNTIEIASLIKSSYTAIVSFYIYPGWRAEEIADALPTSGIEVEPEDFLKIVRNPSGFEITLPFEDCSSAEGFLFPGEYEIDRKITPEKLVKTFIEKFESQVTLDIVNSIRGNGLSFCEGITLASIIQRETFMDDERALIASVFINRLASGIKLETDPTVQYSLGYSKDWNGWWKTPLRLGDLSVDSPFNTYLINGLPPSPISNPDLPSILAVANPEDSPYFYFRANCDKSGYHVFSITFEEHLSKECK